MFDHIPTSTFYDGGTEIVLKTKVINIATFQCMTQHVSSARFARERILLSNTSNA